MLWHVSTIQQILSLIIMEWQEDDEYLNQNLTVRMENRVEVRDFARGEVALVCHKQKYK